MNNIPIEERLAIQELTYRYAQYCDTYQLEELLDLFADDAFFDETRLGAPLASGKAQLRETYANGFKGLAMAHHITNGLVNEYSGNKAKGTCFIHAVCRIKETNEPWQLDGYYQDEYIKLDGKWKFQSRIVIPLIQPEPCEVLMAPPTAS